MPYDNVNSSVFSRRMNTGSDRLFHTCAAATGNARSPIAECYVHGTINAAVDADRKRRRESVSARRSFRHRKMRTASRNCMRSGTRSQWSSRSSGVMWSYFRAEKTRWAAAFSRHWVGIELQPIRRLDFTHSATSTTQTVTRLWSDAVDAGKQKP